MKAMSDHNGHFAVVIAGYPQRIHDFIEGPNANPGLPRRFPEPNRITLNDYTPQQLQAIFEGAIARRGLTLDPDLRVLLPNFIAAWHRNRDLEKFGNAGAMINLAAAMERACVLREGEDGPSILIREDVPENLRLYLPVANS